MGDFTGMDQAEDFDILRDLGGNAVRLAHYQHDQYSYELADALGIVVWAEIPLVNKVSFDVFVREPFCSRPMPNSSSPN